MRKQNQSADAAARVEPTKEWWEVDQVGDTYYIRWGAGVIPYPFAYKEQARLFIDAHNASCAPTTQDLEGATPLTREISHKETGDILRAVVIDPDDPLGEFERIGDWYYRETGFLRPGKSEPIETGRSSNDPENRQRFSDWWDNKRREALTSSATTKPVATEGKDKDLGVTLMPLDLNTLADRLINEDERPRCIVRVSTHAWRDKKSLHYEKRISFLRRLSRLHEILDYDADMIGAGEVIEKITNLDKVGDGIYEVITTNEHRDWETGTLDDYDYFLVPFDPKLRLSADVAASTLSGENKNLLTKPPSTNEETTRGD